MKSWKIRKGGLEMIKRKETLTEKIRRGEIIKESSEKKLTSANGLVHPLS